MSKQSPSEDGCQQRQRALRGTDWALTLARVPWELFATLTFKGSVPRRPVCFGMAFRLLRELSRHTNIQYDRLLIALRDEHGEQGARFHFHLLIGGTNATNYHALEHWLEYQWKLIANGARVDVRKYDRAQAGAAYIAKNLGANAYELGKYNLAESVTLSNSVMRLVACAESRGERRGGLHN